MRSVYTELYETEKEAVETKIEVIQNILAAHAAGRPTPEKVGELMDANARLDALITYLTVAVGEEKLV